MRTYGVAMPRAQATALSGRQRQGRAATANLWPMTSLHQAPRSAGQPGRDRAGPGERERAAEAAGVSGAATGGARNVRSKVRCGASAVHAICWARRARARQRVLSRPGGCESAGGARSASHPSRPHRSHPARRAARSRFGRRRGGVAPLPPFFVLVRCATEEMYTPQQHETTEVVYGRMGGGISE